jgi:hypothetical protein
MSSVIRLCALHKTANCIKCDPARNVFNHCYCLKLSIVMEVYRYFVFHLLSFDKSSGATIKSLAEHLHSLNWDSYTSSDSLTSPLKKMLRCPLYDPNPLLPSKLTAISLHDQRKLVWFLHVNKTCLMFVHSKIGHLLECPKFEETKLVVVIAVENDSA